MVRKRLFLVGCLCGISFFSEGWATEAPKVDPLDELIPMNPHIRAGTLKNGMQYYIDERENEVVPSKEVSLRLLVRVGSAMEEENEHGLAHFIRHMVFRGTKNFTEKELLHFWQENGNSLEETKEDIEDADQWTCFRIDLANNEEALVQKGLTILNDLAFQASFLPEDIEREKKVVAAEICARQSKEQRISDGIRAAFYPRPFHRPIFGTEKSLQSFQQESLLKFYQKWYTPGRMKILVTGNIEEKAVIAWLQKIFQHPQVPEAPEPKIEEQVVGDGSQKGEEDPNTNRITLTVLAMKPLQKSKGTTLRDLQRKFAWDIIQKVVSWRLQEERRNGVCFDASFQWKSSPFPFYQGKFCWSAKIGDYLEIISMARTCIQAFCRFGFLPSDLEDAKKQYAEDVKKARSEESVLTSCRKADELLSSLKQGETVVSAEQKCRAFQALSFTITPDFCKSLWQDLWKQEGNRYQYFLGKRVCQPMKRDWRVTPFQELQKEQIKVGPNVQPVKILDHRYHSDVGIETFQFNNHVHVTLKPTPFVKDCVVSVNFGLGRMMDGRASVLPSDVSFRLFKNLSLEEKNREEWQLKEDSFVWNIYVNKDDLLTFQRIKHFLENYSTLAMIGLNKQGTIYHLAPEIKTIEPLEISYLTIEKFLSKKNAFLSLMEAGGNFHERLIRYLYVLNVSPSTFLELTIVGHFDRYQILQDLSQTFGQIFVHQKEKRWWLAKPNAYWPKPQTKVFPMKGTTDQAFIRVVWPIPFQKGFEHPDFSRKIETLSLILKNRLREVIQQKLGDTYDPKVTYSLSELFQRGSIEAKMTTKSSCLPKEVVDCVMQIADELAQKGVTQEELDRAKRFLMIQLARARQTNEFWAEWLRNNQSRPEVLKWNLHRDDSYRSIQVKDLNAFAKKYLRRSSAIGCLLKPDQKPSEKEPAVAKN